MYTRRVPIFVYGTLLDPGVMAAVTGRRHKAWPALLPGYRRYRLRHRGYPGIVSETGASVSGCVYYVDRPALRALDRYEDACYERRRVSVQVGEAGESAFAYVIPKPHRHLIDPRPWEPVLRGTQ